MKNAHGNRQQNKKRRETLFAYSWSLPSLVLILLIVIFPILYTGYISMTNMNIYHWNNYEFIGLENYKDALLVFDNGFLTALLVTILWTVVNMVLQLVISLGTGIPAAYAFSRKRFPGRKAILKLLILLYAFPSLLSMTALYKLLSPMGLINTRTGLVIVYTGTMAVFALWNMKGYFDTIPVEIEEAAMIDGATQLEQVTKIVLPLAKPTIAVTAMMVLVYVWNEYIFAINFMTGSDTYTLAAGLYSLQATEMSGSWPIFSAASLIVSLPILIVFFALQKNMTEGLTSGGVKG